MSIKLHPELEARLLARAQSEGVTVEAYLEDLMREEDARIAHTEALLQEAAESGDHIELNEEEWDHIEREALAQVENKLKRRS